MNLPDSGRHVTRVNQGLFSTTMEAEKRDPGNEVGKTSDRRLLITKSKGPVITRMPIGGDITPYVRLNILMAQFCILRM